MNLRRRLTTLDRLLQQASLSAEIVGRKTQRRSSKMFGELTGLEHDVLRLTITRNISARLMTSVLAVSNCTSSPSFVFPYCAPVKDEAVCWNSSEIECTSTLFTVAVTVLDPGSSILDLASIYCN